MGKMEESKGITDDYGTTLNVDNEKIRAIIRTLSHYIYYTNPDYKYNQTYLNDYTYEFIESLKIYKFKDEILNNVIERLKNNKKYSYIYLNEFIITFDYHWYISSKNKIIDLTHKEMNGAAFKKNFYIKIEYPNKQNKLEGYIEIGFYKNNIQENNMQLIKEEIISKIINFIEEKIILWNGVTSNGEK